MKLAIYQGPSPEGSAERGFAVIERMLGAAGAAGGEMCVFPEVYLPGYNVAAPGEAARSVSQWIGSLGPIARDANCALTLGVAERDGDHVYNTALAIDRHGELLSHYRKTQLYGVRENRLFRRGNKLSTFDFEGRKAALLICYDIEFAPLIRDLALRGVSLILCPTANMMPYTYVSRLTVPSQAINHAVAIAYANYCGTEGDLTYAGGSVLAGADGNILMQAGLAETLMIADLPDPDPTLISTQLADFRPVE